MQTLICPECGKEIEVSQALAHEVEEKYKVELDKKLKDAEAEREKRVRELLDKLVESEKEKRDMKKRDEERGLEMEKKLSEAEDKIRQEALKKAEEGQHLKLLEMQKKLDDAVRMNDDLKHKLQQGSQQTQGEVLELELEQLLKKAFPEDQITEVGKGVRGADVTETVVNKYGQKCGIILWELKNAKWSEGWIDKLNEDKRQVNANLAVLVSVNLPENIIQFGYYKGVWLTNRECVVGLAWSLRMNLGQVYAARQTAEGKKEKAGVMYDYITGVEFKNRVEGIMEAYVSLLDELEKEKRWFGMKWAREEKEIRRVLDNTMGMYGELQGVSGRSLPEIKALEPGE